MERFGDYLLLKELESTPLGHWYRAARASGKGKEALVGLLILDAPYLNMPGLIAHLEKEKGVFAALRGSQIARVLQTGEAKGTPFVAFEHTPGKSLAEIFARSRAEGFPLPNDHALLIAERLSAALEVAHKTKFDGGKVAHGFVVPQFVIVTSDGEVKLAGFALAGGLPNHFETPAVQNACSPYLAPEHAAGVSSPAADVYSVGAILFELLTGTTLPPGTEPEAVEARLAEGELASDGSPIPDDIRDLLSVALATDPAARFPNGGECRKELGKLIFTGNYSPTTFNLAFFMHNLFRKDFEIETKELAQEEAMDFAASSAGRAAPAVTPPASPATSPHTPEATDTLAIPVPAPKSKAAPAVPTFGAAEPARSKSAAHPVAHETPVLAMPQERSHTPMIAGVAIAVLLLGGGLGYYMMSGKSDQPAPAPSPTLAETTPLPSPSPILSPSPAASLTPEEQKAAFDAEVKRRVAEELAKVKAEMLKDKQAAALPAAATEPAGVATPAPALGRPSPEPPRPAPASDRAGTGIPATSNPTAPVATAAPVASAAPPPAPSPEPEVSAVKEGDLVDATQVDTPPALVSTVLPEYPPIARQKRISGMVLLTVTVDERGKVADVKLLRGAGGAAGLNEAAMKAVRSFEFRPAKKDGKKVKTTLTVPISFTP